MIINDDIVCDYLANKSIGKYKDRWFFKEEGFMFKEPSYEENHKESVRQIYEQINRGIIDFIPCNVEIWDRLFPNWKTILNHVPINLIIGLKDPYDATVLKAPDGKINVILDLGLWTKYEGKCNISSVVHNLLAHELCHVCIGEVVSGINYDIESKDYLINLDANTFNEGFAHLISFDDRNIYDVNWNNEEWLKVRDKCRKKMSEALIITDSDKQKEFLYTGFCGNYKEKYGAICGIFYLVDNWLEKGILGLEEEFKKGYYGFAQKTIEKYQSTTIL